MDKNVGGFDRTWRIILGPVLLAVGLALVLNVVNFGSGTTWTVVVPWLLLVVGGIFAMTAATQFCPINQLLGRNTCKR